MTSIPGVESQNSRPRTSPSSARLPPGARGHRCTGDPKAGLRQAKPRQLGDGRVWQASFQVGPQHFEAGHLHHITTPDFASRGLAQRQWYRALSHRCNPMSGPAAEVATDSGVAPAARRCRQGAGDARATYEYLGKMLVASLERLEQLVTRESES